MFSTLYLDQLEMLMSCGMLGGFCQTTVILGGTGQGSCRLQEIRSVEHGICPIAEFTSP